MAVIASEIKFIKPATVTDTGVNGGRKGNTEKISGARHSLFPRVTKTERLNGVTRYRKEFWHNQNENDETAFDVMLFLEFPSIGGDRFYLGKGEQLDTQADIVATPPAWIGVGQLNTALSGGETSVDILMENDDYEFPPGSMIHIHDKILTSQTIDAAVKPGDSVQETAGTWYKIPADTDIEYPKGIYLGTDSVLSLHGTAGEEFLFTAENLVTDEVIGTGDATTSPALTDLAAVTNGLYTQEDYRPVVKAISGAVERTVYIEADGSCSGYCSAGQINVDTGVWTTDITWLTAIDSGEDITVTYYDKNYSYTGNVVTVDLSESVANSYATANTYVSGTIQEDEVITSFSNWVETTAAGTYDENSYPPTLYNDGTEEDVWTITFTSPTAFTVSGLYSGSVGSGVITSDFEPINPQFGQPYFSLLASGWGGTWAAGETIVFRTHPSAFPVWWREIVPAGTTQEPDNLAILGWYSE